MNSTTASWNQITMHCTLQLPTYKLYWLLVHTRPSPYNTVYTFWEQWNSSLNRKSSLNRTCLNRKFTVLQKGLLIQDWAQRELQLLCNIWPVKRSESLCRVVSKLWNMQKVLSYPWKKEKCPMFWQLNFASKLLWKGTKTVLS